jgi:hypothetical protein
MSVPGTPQSAPRAAPRRILEDASGRRLQRMRWVGRLVALLFLIWLAIVILGGLGVGPVGRLPLGHVLRPSAGPPPLRHAPAPSAPVAADLVPALPAPAPAPTATNGTAPSTTTPGKSGVAPGHAKTTTAPGRSGVSPGHTATSPGKSVAAPGHVRHSTTTTAGTTTTVPGHRKKP